MPRTWSRRRLPRRGVLADIRGGALIEFALLAPAYLLLAIGTVEVGTIMLAQSLLQNAATDASRFGLTGRSLAGKTREQAIQAIVEADGFGLLQGAGLVFTTLVYPSFDDVGKPESFTDKNRNGRWDAGEPFTDTNGNGHWDADMGKAGLGGPSDVVLYRVRYDWRVWTPLFQKLLPGDGVIRMEADLAVRNEPYPPGGS